MNRRSEVPGADNVPGLVDVRCQTDQLGLDIRGRQYSVKREECATLTENVNDDKFSFLREAGAVGLVNIQKRRRRVSAETSRGRDNEIGKTHAWSEVKFFFWASR
ncbi:MAG: hypothetical protein HC902_00060 [Calothrix sp. SM1_5_4]|nr:hypothetical protein [Calothrix sp. SM1_5_4]